MAELVHGLADLALRLFVSFRLAAIPLLLPLSKSNFAFCDAVTEVNPQRHQGQTFLIGFAIQFFDFPLFQQQLSGTQSRVVT